MAEKRQSTQTTLQLSVEGGHKADQALLIYGTKTSLTVALGMSRTTITNFFARRTVEQAKFKKICRELKIKVEEVIEDAVEVDRGIDALVKKLRVAVQPLIQSQCGTMRVLDMDQPIELTGDRGIYTNVNILEKQSRLRSQQELPKDSELEEFDRFTLGKAIGKAIPGLQAVQKHQRLMVLGKPGAGKTTFLKYLAMQCVTGGFASNRVPFFITLKDFAEADKTPNLVEYLVRLSPKVLTLEIVENLLEKGRALILLDGLDEVRDENIKRVIRQIETAVDKSRDSQFVMTCRIAAKEYMFQQFTEVEVADFVEEQIQIFVENWFRAKQDEAKIENFIRKLNEDTAIHNLASSPLLLTLLCLVFGDRGGFPTSRSDLYKEGVEILLKKWDAQRNIERDQIYKKLDIQRKKDLISHIALQTFIKKEYFIKEQSIILHTSDFIQHLPSIDPYPEVLEVNSKDFLRSIEAHHGILIERAWHVYSFSHLTFHEYFTAREIVESHKLHYIVENFCDRRWREVILLAIEMARDSTEVLTNLKHTVDSIVSSDQIIQEFLKNIKEESDISDINSKSALRAHYYSCRLDRLIDKNRTIRLKLSCALDDGMQSINDHRILLVLNLEKSLEISLDLIDENGTLEKNSSCRKLRKTLTLSRAYADQDAELRLKIQELLETLLGLSDLDESAVKQWWSTDGSQWTRDLRKIMITYRNIGYDWQFTGEQKQLLQQYYDANLLLVQCLKSDCYVSRHVRQSIEDTLLLPYEELKIENVE